MGFFQDQSLPVIALLLFFSMILVTFIGYKSGKRQSKSVSPLDKLEKTTGTLVGSMLALLGFILAISVSMSDSHYESRRKLVLDEANAIGTSRLRAATLGGEHGKEIARLLDQYARIRVDFFSAGENPDQLRQVQDQTSNLQTQIWTQASAIANLNPTAVSALLLSSLNEVFDLTNTRRWAFEVRIPPYLLNILFIFALVSMGMMGYYFGICGVHHSILSTLLFAAFTMAILLVMDLNRPRGGFIQPEQSPMIWLLEESHQRTP
jgi:hypothetical protein